MAPLLCLMLFLAMTGYSSASYCLCKDGVGDQALQKALDYACGAGADCTPIQQNGACYNPNTLKDHCSYAVNSYFQKKAQAGGSCDFSGTATINPNPPSSEFINQLFLGTGTTPTTPTTGTPSTTPTTGAPPTTPTTGTPPTTPTTGTTTGTPPTTPTTGIPSTTPTTGTGTTTGSPTVFGGGTTLGPSGTTTTGINDSSDAVAVFTTTNTILFTFIMTLWIVGSSGI
ncbi:hypothetical protein DITRI_Ditri17bG0115800 [Diplodiscus trichospermus]